MVTVALARIDGRIRLLAVTVTGPVRTADGAVNRPSFVILPAVADQTTAELLILLTVAAN
jgi:hypothetical protein